VPVMRCRDFAYRFCLPVPRLAARGVRGILTAQVYTRGHDRPLMNFAFYEGNALMIGATFILSSEEAQGDDQIMRTAQLTKEIVKDLGVAASVERALCAAGHAPLRAVEVWGEGNGVVLKGHVPTYYLKVLAQATALCVPGVERVRNDLEVGPGGGRPS
jgi:BON domain